MKKPRYNAMAKAREKYLADKNKKRRAREKQKKCDYDCKKCVWKDTNCSVGRS